MKARRQRCTARISDGSRQCERWAINGSTICATHGGRAPQVQRSARERLAALVEPAIGALQKALKSGDTPAVIRAALGVLDRCGYGPKQSMELSGPDGEPIKMQDTGELARILDSLPTELKRGLLAALVTSRTVENPK